MVKYTEKQIEKKIRKLTTAYNNNKISKKEFLQKQADLFDYALKNLNLSKIKRAYIEKGLNICKTVLNFLK